MLPVTLPASNAHAPLDHPRERSFDFEYRLCLTRFREYYHVVIWRAEPPLETPRRGSIARQS